MLQKQVTWSILGNTKFQSGLGIDREIKESILLELRGNQVKKKRRHTQAEGTVYAKVLWHQGADTDITRVVAVGEKGVGGSIE